MELRKRVRTLIEEYGLLDRGDGVIVGCSGGPDSMCLLHCLMELKEPLDLTLRVVHLEHGFRGEASERDAQYVEQFCKERGIDCVVHREQVRELAREAGISEETAGREVRYRRFFQEKDILIRIMSDRGIADPQVKIAVAHNKNDQAETILMRIMRGTGLDGLCGMEPAREDGLIRPLLTTERRDIEAYCEEHGLDPRRDHTNEEPDYTRNRIRLELIPYMKEHFNDSVEDALCRLGAIAEESRKMIQKETDRTMECLDRDEEGRVRNRRALATLEDGPRHAVIRRTLKALGLETNLSQVHLQQIDRLLKSDTASGSVDLPGGYRIGVSYEQILWQPPASAGEDAAQTRREIGEILISERDREMGDTVEALRHLPDHVKCFDGDKIRAALDAMGGGRIELRTRRPGDVIRPLGSPGRKKLQDWFVDQKIPRQMRDDVPLVSIGSEILWIVGHRISETYKVEEQTKRLIFVEFHQ